MERGFVFGELYKCCKAQKVCTLHKKSLMKYVAGFLLIYYTLLSLANAQTTFKNCDTIMIEDYYYEINNYDTVQYKFIEFSDEITDSIQNNGKTEFLHRRKILSNLSWFYYTSYGMLCEEDREYLVFDNYKILVDLLYYNKLYSGITFRSIDGVKVYEFYDLKFTYYALYSQNTSLLMGKGFTLLLFAKNKNSGSLQLIHISADQVSPDMRNFGLNKTNSSIIFFDWDYQETVHNSNPEIVKYQIINGTLEYLDVIKPNISAVNNWYIKVCE